MAEEAVGSIIFGVNGDEYDCVSCESQHSTGRKPVPTMNRKQKIKYVTSGLKTWALSAVVVIPDGKDGIDWDTITDARISIESPTGNHRTTYIDCSATEVSESYSVEGETRRNLSLFALDKIKEDI